jgi:diguanylate cyclase
VVINLLPLIIGACLFGGGSLLCGIAIGYMRGRRVLGKSSPELLQTGALTMRLQALATEICSSLGKHRHDLQLASQLLTEDEPGDEAIADLVANVIGDVVHSNQKLQAKLDLAEERLQEQAVEIEAHISRSLTDPLTGLPNRREFNERLEERMGTWSRRQEVFALVLVDVDHFKKLNDQHGHLAGDLVLSTLADCLRKAIRREDAIARFGGEEFAILLPNTSLPQATLVAEKIRDAVARILVNHNGQRIAITVSSGSATIQPNEPIESLIQRADTALYAAKAAGRNCSFSHDGKRCSGPDGELIAAPSSTAVRLIELIKSHTADLSPNCDEPRELEVYLGAYLQREGISQSLAEACQDLRGLFERPEASTAPTA